MQFSAAHRLRQMAVGLHGCCILRAAEFTPPACKVAGVGGCRLCLSRPRVSCLLPASCCSVACKLALTARSPAGSQTSPVDHLAWTPSSCQSAAGTASWCTPTGFHWWVPATWAACSGCCNNKLYSLDVHASVLRGKTFNRA